VILEDPIVEILGEGVAIALPATASGTLLAQLVQPGEAVQVGQHLAVIERDADEWD
jgi:pyruvate/2-oxoglutarate dehydrogenase complex dihydrolipoamide acyltransferase (E2) component